MPSLSLDLLRNIPIASQTYRYLKIKIYYVRVLKFTFDLSIIQEPKKRFPAILESYFEPVKVTICRQNACNF